MKTLAIETSTAVCGAAVIQYGRVVAERHIEARQIHSQEIMGLIDDVLRSAHFDVHDLEGIAVSIGPGSFTGLRIGVSTAKGLAYAIGKPVAAVSTLKALALHVARLVGAESGVSILPTIDARRDEVYVALYRYENTMIKELISPRDVMLSELNGMLDEEKRILVAGDGAEKIQQFVTTGNDDRLERLVILPREQRLCSAGTVGILGEEQLLRGEFADLGSLEPMYVKEFHTTMKPQATVQR